MLHIVKHYNQLADAIAYSSELDVILLVEDGIYAAVEGHKYSGVFSSASIPGYCLTADVNARGVTVSDPEKLIDYAGFVELTETHLTSMTWE